ncbi:MAG TPA: hypothetical protein VI139_09535 [Gemmatimonadales bacterium]
MKIAALLGLALLAAAPAVRAQRVQAGVQVAFGDYREVSGDLHWRGAGPAAWGSVRLRKLSLEGRFARIKYDPVANGSATEGFKATQIDGFARYYLASHVSAEVGVTNRKADPEFDAQSMAAFRIGARGSYDLGPGATIALRGNYLAGAKFSGGGTAAFAFDLGLGIAVGATSGRYHVTGDYDFQTAKRKTVTTAPLQQTLARIGIAVGF